MLEYFAFCCQSPSKTVVRCNNPSAMKRTVILLIALCAVTLAAQASPVPIYSVAAQNPSHPVYFPPIYWSVDPDGQLRFDGSPYSVIYTGTSPLYGNSIDPVLVNQTEGK